MHYLKQFGGALLFFTVFFTVVFLVGGKGLQAPVYGFGTGLLFSLFGALRMAPGTLAWRKFARTTRLHYQPPTGIGALVALLFTDYGTVEGVYRERAVKLCGVSRTRGIDKNRSTSYHPHITVAVANPMDASISIGGQLKLGFVMKAAVDTTLQLMGRETIETEELDDADWNAQFQVVSQPPKFASRVLRSSDLRSALRQLRPITLKLEGQELQLTEQSSAKRKPEYLHTCLDALCDFAEAIEQVAEPVARLSHGQQVPTRRERVAA